MSWSEFISIWKLSIVPLGSGNHIFWPSIFPPTSFVLPLKLFPSDCSLRSLLQSPARPGSNLDLSTLSSPFIRLHSAPFTPPKSWFHLFYLSNLAVFSLCFVSRVIPSSPSTCQSWQRRSTRLTSTRDKIWRALCGSMLNTLTPFSLAASPKRWVERKSAGPQQHWLVWFVLILKINK